MERVRSRLKTSAGKVGHIYPFTVAGTLLCVLVLTVLIASLRVINPYGLALSLVGLLVLVALSIAGRIQAARFRDLPIQWDSSRALIARAADSRHHVELPAISLLPFFRVHLELTAQLKVGEHASLLLFGEYASRDGRMIEVPWDLPLSGLLRATGRLAVKDLFGLSRSRFGPPHTRSMIVRPAPFAEIQDSPIAPVHGEEDSTRQTQAEEERYFQREYVPGDRYRDINWKASSRLAELVTRISPLTQEKTQLVQIEFRHFTGDKRDSLESVVHLDALKSWLITFIRRQRRDKAGYRFRVITGHGIHEVEKDGDLEVFAQELGVLFLQPDPGTDQGREDGGEVFLFSTPFDVTLPYALSAYQRAHINLFRTVQGHAQVPRVNEHDIRVPFGSWLLGGDTPLLPGGWVLRRNRKEGRPVTVAGHVDAPLRVALMA